VSGSKIHIGTSGWQYLPFRGRFYPQDLPNNELLSYYTSRLGTVEVNRTFYNFPRATTFEGWRDHTPPQFKIAIKAHRSFTHGTSSTKGNPCSGPLRGARALRLAHDPGLGDPTHRLDEFISRARILGSHLGPILFQLAASVEVDFPALEAFLQRLPRDLQFAFELRHPSWHQPRIWKLLERAGAAFCIHDIRGKLSPLGLTADFAYVRLHGPGARAYIGAYGEKALTEWAERIQSWKRETYVFFDNTMAGDAIDDALLLQKILGSADQADLEMKEPNRRFRALRA
jgi:uncharacterized protein YecE (DUF72 family)